MAARASGEGRRPARIRVTTPAPMSVPKILDSPRVTVEPKSGRSTSIVVIGSQ
ncbi:MAG TPA: hypothetical protein VKU88_01595 [Acidimicrobiales bacterium]|nr:hypothetical protein [Acidimicrobiales bacterium]